MLPLLGIEVVPVLTEVGKLVIAKAVTKGAEAIVEALKD